MNPEFYGKDWEKLGTVVHSLGIIIAPEIFVAPSDITLSGGQTVRAGTKYFSWGTAVRLVHSFNVPFGWRMLTLIEGKALADYHAGSNFGNLVFGLDGLIGADNMPYYTSSPSLFQEKEILFKGTEGYYWTSDRNNSLYPYVITNGPYGLKAGCIVYSNYGLPLLLAKDI